VVAAEGDDVAVVWFDAGSATVRVTRASTGESVTVGETATLGPARPGGGFGQASQVAVDGSRNGDVVRAAWTHGADVDAATVALSGDLEPSEVREVAPGRNPAVAAGDDRWLGAWLYRTQATGWDVGVRLSRDGGPRTLSELPSNADRPRAAFAPRPAVAWFERGEDPRLLVSTYRGPRQPGAVERLAATPGQFVFVGVGSVVAGAVTTPILPWSFLALLGAFLASTRLVCGGVSAVVAAGGGRLGGRDDPGAGRRRLRAAPPLVYGSLFAVVQAALAVAIVTTDTSAFALGFSHPLGASVVAFLGALVLYGLLDRDSAWWFAATAAFTLNAVLWSTAMPGFL
jgi:hypothetical protein